MDVPSEDLPKPEAMPDKTPAGSPNDRMVIDELHLYSRHLIQLWVQWFTFFLTVNYVALGWFAGGDHNKLTNRCSLVYIAALFITQNVLGIIVCMIARRYFSKTAQVLATQYQQLNIVAPEFGQRVYVVAVMVGAVAMVFVVACWLLFAVSA